ncbi:hypothetical protein [Laceyella putida]|uniref:Glycosyltransferase 2-like domain-containing protein n=1 Tax=Laceyella putida TaxID=110101 RepID=A0ABW2RGA0_9BACL
MEQWVLWSAALCFAVVFLVKTIPHFYGNAYHNKAVHLVIITENSQQAVEWMIRSYHGWKGAKGKPGKVTCIDTGSTDDTKAILERLKHRFPHLEVLHIDTEQHTDDAIANWLKGQEQGKEKLVVLDLREMETTGEKSKRFLA